MWSMWTHELQKLTSPLWRVLLLPSSLHNLYWERNTDTEQGFRIFTVCMNQLFQLLYWQWWKVNHKNNKCLCLDLVFPMILTQNGSQAFQRLEICAFFSLFQQLLAVELHMVTMETNLKRFLSSLSILCSRSSLSKRLRSLSAARDSWCCLYEDVSKPPKAGLKEKGYMW